MDVQKYIKTIVFLGIYFLQVSCSTELVEMQMQSNLALRLQVTLNSLQTRSVIDPTDGSRMEFGSGDRIGLYAFESGSASSAYYENLEMEYVGNSSSTDADGNPITVANFEPVDKSIVIDFTKLNRCFAYCPYDANMGDGIGDNDEHGINVRQAGTDNVAIDLLWDNKIKYESGVFSANFTHAFAMLIIYGGEGFTDVAADGRESVEVITDDELVRAIVYESTNYGGYAGIKFKPDSDYGGQYKLFKGIKGEYAGRKAWCVIVPCSSRGSDYVGIASITAIDDIGNVHNISLSSMSQEVKDKLTTLKPGWRYPVELKLEGLVPTIYTYDIAPWNRYLIDISGIGIKTHDDFTAWVATYNKYIQDGRPQSLHEDLKRFGDFDGTKWQFYLNTDINYAETSHYVIDRLDDVFDGRGHTFNNFKMTNSALVSVLGGNGAVKNLNFKNLTVNYTMQGVIGGIVSIMNGGEVYNCTIFALSMDCPGSAVGAIAGTMTSGSITYCAVTGVMLAASTEYITANTSSGTVSENSVTGLIFGVKN